MGQRSIWHYFRLRNRKLEILLTSAIPHFPNPPSTTALRYPIALGWGTTKTFTYSFLKKKIGKWESKLVAGASRSGHEERNYELLLVWDSMLSFFSAWTHLNWLCPLFYILLFSSKISTPYSINELFYNYHLFLWNEDFSFLLYQR